MVLDNLDIKIVYILLGVTLGVTFCAILGVAFWWGRQWATKKEQHVRPPAPPTRAPTKPVEAESEFFHSLSAAQKRLEALLSQAEATEQKLQRRAPPPDPIPADPYATAAFLLANGEDVDHVARKLNLSSTQVRLVQELRQELEDKLEDNTEAKEEKAARMQKQLWGKNGVGH
jgi:flagellar basal body-associated protein FliL